MLGQRRRLETDRRPVACAEQLDRQRLDPLGRGLRLGWIERKTRPGRADLPSVVADERISGEHHTVLADENDAPGGVTRHVDDGQASDYFAIL
jgi:hypothetical protein